MKTVFVIQPALATPYDNAESQLLGENVQDALDEIVVASGRVRTTTFVGALSLAMDASFRIYSEHAIRIQAAITPFPAQNTVVTGAIASNIDGKLIIPSNSTVTVGVL